MDRYINMFINIVIRRLMTLGINKGIDAATKSLRDKDLSAEQKKRLKDSANAAKRMRRF